MDVFWEIFFDGFLFASITSAVNHYPLTREKESQTLLPVSLTLKPSLADVACPLAGLPLHNKSKKEKAATRRLPFKHVWRKGRLFRRVQNRLVVMVPKAERKAVTPSRHDELGHWDMEATQALVKDRFWWRRAHRNAVRYVQSCGVCQRMKKGLVVRLCLSCRAACSTGSR